MPHWKKKYARLWPSEMRQRRELEDQNNRLKKIVADLPPNCEMLADWGVSIRRVCLVLPFYTSSYHYHPRCTYLAFLKKRIKQICETYGRYGHRRVYYILRRNG